MHQGGGKKYSRVLACDVVGKYFRVLSISTIVIDNRCILIIIINYAIMDTTINVKASWVG